MPALDRYDEHDIDDEEVGETFEAREEARLRAERDMDRAQGVRRTRLPAALLEGSSCSETCESAAASCLLSSQALNAISQHTPGILTSEGCCGTQMNSISALSADCTACR